MTTEDFDRVEELFAQLLDRYQSESTSSNPHYLSQLQGQVEESLGLLNDAIEELRTIDPESVCTLKSLTLKIFDEETH